MLVALVAAGWFFVIGGIGLWIGERKNRPATGLLLALVGPVGWFFLAFVLIPMQPASEESISPEEQAAIRADIESAFPGATEPLPSQGARTRTSRGSWRILAWWRGCSPGVAWP